MTDYTWPEDLVPFAQSFYLQAHTGGSESPFSRQTKIYNLSRPRWVCSMRLRAPASRDRWGTGPYGAWGERIDAFLAKLDGRTNRVQLWDFRRPGRSQPFTNAAATAATNTITLTGGNGYIRVGEYIGGDGRPHIIHDLAPSGADTVATVRPYFETDISMGAATYVNVSGYFRLTSDDAAQNGSAVGELTEYSLDFVEDWGPSVDVTFDGEIVTYSG